MNLIKRDFLESYKMLDTLDDKERLLYVCNDRSAFYYEIKKPDSAYIFASRAYEIGTEAKFFDDVLKSLVLMSKSKSEDDQRNYLNEYIELNDSLINNERAFVENELDAAPFLRVGLFLVPPKKMYYKD